MSELVRLRGKIYFTKYILCSVCQGLPCEPDDDGDVDDHYDEDDQCLCQGVPGEPDGKLPSQKWCQLARSQN